jgi:hypothetical protein
LIVGLTQRACIVSLVNIIAADAIVLGYLFALTVCLLFLLSRAIYCL